MMRKNGHKENCRDLLQRKSQSRGNSRVPQILTPVTNKELRKHANRSPFTRPTSNHINLPKRQTTSNLVPRLRFLASVRVRFLFLRGRRCNQLQVTSRFAWAIHVWDQLQPLYKIQCSSKTTTNCCHQAYCPGRKSTCTCGKIRIETALCQPIFFGSKFPYKILILCNFGSNPGPGLFILHSLSRKAGEVIQLEFSGVHADYQLVVLLPRDVYLVARVCS